MKRLALGMEKVQPMCDLGGSFTEISEIADPNSLD